MGLIDFAVFVAGLTIAIFLATELSGWLRARRSRHPPAAPRPSKQPRLAKPARPAPVKYDWERRRDQLYRRVKGIQGPAEDREAILAFVESRTGVEAYVEPRTVMHPLSVVLVAKDGEWHRFELTDDAFLRELRRSRGLPIFDAVRVGYPERMRRYRRPERAAGDPDPDPGPPDEPPA